MRLLWISACWQTAFLLIDPASVHGILWLQTHFESKHWELLADGRVTVSRTDAEELRQDATAAGLDVQYSSNPFAVSLRSEPHSH